jgi:hypothetical protein
MFPSGPIIASFLEIAQAAFHEIVFNLFVLFDRRSAVPGVAARTVHAYLAARGWKPA